MECVDRYLCDRRNDVWTAAAHDPVDHFLSKPTLGDSVLVKHVFSHTSQGTVGTSFYYSARFGLLTQVIERASGQPFSEVLGQRILKPLQLKHTFLLEEATQTEGMAKPYLLEKGVEEGFVDYGYSASAGIISNLEDLRAFDQALENHTLISKASGELLARGLDAKLPYGYGIFSQHFQGVDLIWAYGQYDCYSSLLLKVPSKNITLTLLANNRLLSDPARLIYGDVTTSLSAISLLKNYIFDRADMQLFESEANPSPTSYYSLPLYRKKVLAEALAASYMARYETGRYHQSIARLEHVFSVYPDYSRYANLSVIHTLSFLKTVAYYKDLGELHTFDSQLEGMATHMLTQTPDNPYLHYYLGTYYDGKGDKAQARYHFSSIVDATNFSKNWYTMEAQDWLDANQ